MIEPALAIGGYLATTAGTCAAVHAHRIRNPDESLTHQLERGLAALKNQNFGPSMATPTLSPAIREMTHPSLNRDAPESDAALFGFLSHDERNYVSLMATIDVLDDAALRAEAEDVGYRHLNYQDAAHMLERQRWDLRRKALENIRMRIEAETDHHASNDFQDAYRLKDPKTGFKQRVPVQAHLSPEVKDHELDEYINKLAETILREVTERLTNADEYSITPPEADSDTAEA